MKHCSSCAYFSPDNNACFHPSAWREIPSVLQTGRQTRTVDSGNWMELNKDYNCAWFEDWLPEDVQPDRRSWVKKLVDKVLGK
jgi:hypothetical protein